MLILTKKSPHIWKSGAKYRFNYYTYFISAQNFLLLIVAPTVLFSEGRELQIRKKAELKAMNA